MAGRITDQTRARTYCDDHGHKYEIVANAVTRKNVDGGTEIHNSFLCAQCGDLITRNVAFWGKSDKKNKSADGEPF